MPRRNNPRKIHKKLRISAASLSSCTNKRRYATEKEAEHAREEQELLNMTLELRVYRCQVPGCGGWHLTRSDSML